jgi:hypothetical protein
MTALQFEAQWEAKHRELERVGLGLQAKQKYTQYLLKIGKEYAESVRMDRRLRKDRAGGETTRTPETWEEAHQVVLELEGIRAGNRAINQVRNSGGVGGASSEQYAGGTYGDDPNKKGKDKGKGKGKETAKGGADSNVCFNWQRDGSCKYGNKCRYSHAGPPGKPSSAGAVRPEPKSKAKPEKTAVDPTPPPPPGAAGGN